MFHTAPINHSLRLALPLLALLLLPLSAAQSQSGKRFAKSIGKAHGAKTWHGQQAFAADLQVSFGGTTVIDGSLLTRTDTGGVRIELKSGAVAVWDGSEAWVTPNADAFPGARFHVLTWPYFLAAPVKLRDPGTHVEVLEPQTLHGKTYETARLTFGEGVGDTPDDWYILYREPGTKQLKAMAYIVTYGTAREKAEEEPHVIIYDDFQDVHGVPIPTTWTFYNWNEEDGAHGDPIGAVKIENPRFVQATTERFAKPDSAVADALPGS